MLRLGQKLVITLIVAAPDDLMYLHLPRAPGICLGIISHGKLKGIVDYEGRHQNGPIEQR